MRENREILLFVLKAFALEYKYTLLPFCSTVNTDMPAGWLPHYLHIYALSFISQCFCLQPVTFGQVWDPPGLSTPLVAGRQIPPAVQNTVGRGRVRVFSLRPMLLLHWEVAEISPIKPEFTTMKSCFVFYKSRGSIEALRSPKSFRKATERTTGGFGSTAKNKPHPNTPTDCGWHWTGPICEM